MLNSNIEYEIRFRLSILILKRKTGEQKTFPCHFCGIKHLHGRGDGHRVAHCGTGEYDFFVIADDGTILYQSDGYIIKNV